MSEERCLSHGCAMPYDRRSGFEICPECEAESELKTENRVLREQNAELVAALNQTINFYDEAISAYPAEFVSLAEAEKFAAQVEAARAILSKVKGQ